MTYICYRIGSGPNRPPIKIGEGKLEEVRELGREYLLKLYGGRLPTKLLTEYDIWIEIEDENGLIVEGIYPSHGRKSQFVVKRYPYGKESV